MISTPSIRFFLLPLLGFLIQGGALGQDSANDQTTVSGTVESSEGSPVAGADVWLIAGNWSEPEVLASTTSNPDGTFKFEIGQGVSLLDDFAPYASVLSQHQVHGFGWFNRLYPERRQNISLKLEPSGQLDGRLIDASGNPVSDAKVFPVTLLRGSVAKSGNEYAQIPKGFSPAWESRTDEQGNFSINGLPSAGAVMLEVEHSTIEKLQVQTNLGQPVAIKLDAPVACTGKIELPAGFNRSNLDREEYWKGRIGVLLDSKSRWKLDY